MNKKIIFVLLSLLIFTSLVSAAASVTVVKPNGGESLNRQAGPYDINFSVTGIDKNTFLVDINYSTSASQGTGSGVINDVNIATLTCSGTDFNQATQTCRYSWDYSDVPNGNYYVLVDVNNVTSTSFDASNATFNIYSAYIKTYSGGDLGNIFIDIIGGVIAAVARNIRALIILLIMGLIALRFKDDIGRIISLFKERMN